MHNQVGWTALHYAAHLGYTVLVTLLLERGADINATDEVSDVVLILE